MGSTPDVSRRRGRFRRGAGDFVGELLFDVGLAVVALALVLAGRAVDWLLQHHPIIGVGLLVVMLALAFYGVWCSLRWRPGLLLDNLRSSDGEGVRPRPVAVVAMGWVQVLAAAGILYLLALWAWGRA